MAPAEEELKKYKRDALKGFAFHLALCACSLVLAMCVVHNLKEIASEHAAKMPPPPGPAGALK